MIQGQNCSGIKYKKPALPTNNPKVLPRSIGSLVRGTGSLESAASIETTTTASTRAAIPKAENGARRFVLRIWHRALVAQRVAKSHVLLDRWLIEAIVLEMNTK